jgi:tetratricopeptide (TPR) repeat protein
MQRAFDVISGDEPDEDLAILAARLANAYWTIGDLERATEKAEFALDLAEAYGYTRALAIALGAKAAVALSRGHSQEGLALEKHQLAVALEHGHVEEASGACFILSDQCFHRDRYEEALGYLDEALALTRKTGNRPYEWSIFAEKTYALFMTGRWDEALGIMEELSEEQARSGGMFLSILSGPLDIRLHRGDLAEARQLYTRFSNLESSTDVQERACYFGATAALSRAEGRLQEALEAGRKVMDGEQTLGLSHQAIEQGLVEALEAALALEDRESAEHLLSKIEATPPGRRPRFLEAHAHRFRGRLGGATSALETAAGCFREIGIPFWLAVTQLEHGELTGEQSLLEEARGIFEGLRATPWVERVEAASSARTEVTA